MIALSKSGRGKSWRRPRESGAAAVQALGRTESWKDRVETCCSMVWLEVVVRVEF
jgi:hypothetical protein